MTDSGLTDGVRAALDDSTKMLPDRMAAALRCIMAYMGAATGAVWGAGADGTLRCRVFASAVAVQIFEYQTKSMHLAPGSGLPGRVTEAGHVEWISDVTHDDNFPRLRGAVRDGLRGAVAFPITGGGSSLGAVELFSRSAVTENKETESVLSEIGRQLGSHPDVARYLRGDH